MSLDPTKCVAICDAVYFRDGSVMSEFSGAQISKRSEAPYLGMTLQIKGVVDIVNIERGNCIHKAQGILTEVILDITNRAGRENYVVETCLRSGYSYSAALMPIVKVL